MNPDLLHEQVRLIKEWLAELHTKVAELSYRVRKLEEEKNIHNRK